MKTPRVFTFILAAGLFLGGIILPADPGAAPQSLDWSMSHVRDIDNILPERQRAEVFNQILEWRLDNILPEILRRENIDLWLVICFEYQEDPVYMTLVPKPQLTARRMSILLFHDHPTEGLKKLTANWHGTGSAGPMYTNIFTAEYRERGANAQFDAVADYIRKHDPKRIGINTAEHWDYHDDFSHGTALTAFNKTKLEQALDPEHKKRLVSAEKVCIGWLETRSPQELSLYRHLCGIGHDLIAEFFSNKVITPDVTTTDDVCWWIRQRITDMGLETWFHPSVSIRRSPADQKKYGPDDRVIRRGDLLHCDVGIDYLGLKTDQQHNAYVLRIGETDAPEGLKALLKKGNRVQKILMDEMKGGRTGNEILRAALRKAKDEGIETRIYTHPIGFHGHGSGMMIGMTEKQDFVPGTGEHPLFPNTIYSSELSVTTAVPEWGGTKVSMGLEEEMVFANGVCRWVDGYPTTFYLIH
jgi:Xaa-Pro aminopeptidase